MRVRPRQASQESTDLRSVFHEAAGSSFIKITRAFSNNSSCARPVEALALGRPSRFNQPFLNARALFHLFRLRPFYSYFFDLRPNELFLRRPDGCFRSKGEIMLLLNIGRGNGDRAYWFR
jgi:hypothetical protein